MCTPQRHFDSERQVALHSGVAREFKLPISGGGIDDFRTLSNRYRHQELRGVNEVIAALFGDTEVGMHNIKLIVAYDGTDFRGWQIKPGQPTAQGVLGDVIEQLT